MNGLLTRMPNPCQNEDWQVRHMLYKMLHQLLNCKPARGILRAILFEMIDCSHPRIDQEIRNFYKVVNDDSKGSIVDCHSVHEECLRFQLLS